MYIVILLLCEKSLKLCEIYLFIFMISRSEIFEKIILKLLTLELSIWNVEVYGGGMAEVKVISWKNLSRSC